MDAVHAPYRSSKVDHAWFALFDALETVFGPDPGLLRLVVAGRSVLAAAIGFAALLLITGGRTKPEIAATALALMMANMSNMAVRDSGRRAQMITMALVPLPALSVVALSWFLSKWPLLADLGFVVVVTLAALARLIGARGMAMGLVAFIGYFIGEIMRPPVSSMPLLAMGVLVGVAASAFMRFVVLPDRPANTLWHVERHLRRRVARILGQAARMAREGAGQERHERTMHRELVRLDEAFATAEDQLDALGESPAGQALGQGFFALELAAERVIRLVASGEIGSEPERAAGRMEKLARLLLSGEVPRPGPAQDGREPLDRALDALEQALERLARSPTATQGETKPSEPPAPPDPSSDPPALLERPEVRQAVQIALGVTAAIGLGGLVSGQRWYWAVIAAFIVAFGVGSRGEAAIKALQRVGGTMLGIVLGIGLATLVASDKILSMALALIALFLAFYAFQAAYGVMMFFITLMLALLYGLLGMFKPELLVLRLEETMIGAAAGLAAVSIVLPIRQDAEFASAARDYRQALAQAIRCAARDAPAQNGAVSQLQAKTRALRAKVGAAKRGWGPLIGDRYRAAVRAAMRCTYLVRESSQTDPLSHDFAESLADMLEEGRARAVKDGSGDELQASMADAVHRLLDRLEPAGRREETG